MSKKITVTPAEVRGWGNLIGEKSIQDYTAYEAEVTSASETVDSRTRTVFTVTANITSSILNLTSSSSTIDLGQSVTLSGTLLDADSSAITGATVKIYMVDSSTPVTVTTGAGGAFSTTVTPSVGGVVSYYAVYDGDETYLPGRSSNVNITVNKLTSTLSLSAVQSSIVVGSTPELTGTLVSNGTGLTGKSVRIYRGTSLVDTVTTTTGGAFSFTDEATSSTGFLTYYAVFEGDSTYTSDESSTVEITVSDHVYSLTASASSTSILVGGSVTISGVLKRDNVAYGSQTVTVYKNDGESVSFETTTTDSSGAYSVTFSNLSIGEISFWASAVSGSAVTDTVTVTVSAHTYSLTAVASSQSITEGQSVTVTGTYKEDNIGYSGQTITVYYKPDGGSESSTTTTTGSGGAYSVTLSGFLASGSPYTVWAETPDVESSDISITVSAKPVPTLSLSAVSSSISVGDTPQLTGSLVYSGSGLTSKSVKIYKGSTLVDTVTTGIGGSFSFTDSATSSSGRLDYKAVFEGDSTYTGAESSVVTIFVSKLATVLSCSASPSSIHVGDSPSFTGFLLDENDDPVAGETVEVYWGNNPDFLVGSDVTDSNGEYAITGSAMSSEGTFTAKAYYFGSDAYVASESGSVTVTVTQVTPADLEVTGTKSILSYADSESCVLTATVTDSSSNPLSGQTVVFKNGSTVLDTKTTDSNGQCTYTYSSSGAGDVTLTVECSLLQETYELTDLWLYDTLTTDKGLFSTTGGVTATYSSNGLTVLGNRTSDSFYVYTGELPSKYSIEYEITGVSYGTGLKNYLTDLMVNGCLIQSHREYGCRITNLTNADNTWVTPNLQVGDIARLEYDGSTVTAYHNNQLIGTYTTYNNQTGFKTYNTRTISVKNMKVKAL